MYFDERLDEKATCAFLGGNRPIHASTLWRGVKSGRFSKPIHIGKQSVRWLKSELEADLARMAAERNNVAPAPHPRTRRKNAPAVKRGRKEHLRGKHIRTPPPTQ
jgi:predicted DNA-binding transcriptional regulator AlpA